MDPVTALIHCGGAARREELLALGVPRRALARALSDFTIWRPQRGTYALSDAPRARVLAAAFRAHLTCVSALREWEVPLLRAAPRGVHLGFPRDRGVTDADPRSRPGLVIHRSGQMSGVKIVDAPTALFDASRCMNRGGLVVAADYMLRNRMLVRSQIRCVTRSQTRWLRAVANPLAASPPESLARLALLDAGYTPEPQAHFTGVGHVDLFVGDAVVVETDGREYHSDSDQFLLDRQRDRALQRLGIRPLRFTGAEVLADPEIVVREVRAHLG